MYRFIDTFRMKYLSFVSWELEMFQQAISFYTYLVSKRKTYENVNSSNNLENQNSTEWFVERELEDPKKKSTSNIR